MSQESAVSVSGFLLYMTCLRLEGFCGLTMLASSTQETVVAVDVQLGTGCLSLITIRVWPEEKVSCEVASMFLLRLSNDGRLRPSLSSASHRHSHQQSLLLRICGNSSSLRPRALLLSSKVSSSPFSIHDQKRPARLLYTVLDLHHAPYCQRCQERIDPNRSLRQHQ